MQNHNKPVERKDEPIRCDWHYGNDRNSFTLPRYVWEDWVQGMITRYASFNVTRETLRDRYVTVLAELHETGRSGFSWYTFTIEGN